MHTGSECSLIEEAVVVDRKRGKNTAVVTGDLDFSDALGGDIPEAYQIAEILAVIAAVAAEIAAAASF